MPSIVCAGRCTRRALLELDLITEVPRRRISRPQRGSQAAVFAELADMEDHDLWPLVNGTGGRDDDPMRQAEIIAMLRKSEVRRPL